MSSFLKRAALQRLSARLSNKREEVSVPFKTNLLVQDLEPSTLSPHDKLHIKRWLQGVESGRACMLAMLDASHADEQEKGDGTTPTTLQDTLLSSDDPPSGTPNADSKSSTSASIELSLLSASVNLPQDFLCTGYLFREVFSKPPVLVVREALQLLQDTAQEQSIAALDCHQINLAIKQIRINNLARAAESQKHDELMDAEENVGPNVSARDRGDKENLSGNSSGDEEDEDEAESEKEREQEAKARRAERHRKQSLRNQARLRRAREEETRLQIVIELLHLHISSNATPDEDDDTADDNYEGGDAKAGADDGPGTRFGSSSSGSGGGSGGVLVEDASDDEDDDDGDWQSQARKQTRTSANPSTPSSSSSSSKVAVDAASPTSSCSSACSSPEPLPPSITSRDIHQHLRTPLEEAENIALQLAPDDLEQSNALLKPYINRLASMRATLQFQVSELEKNEAFFCLGLPQGAACTDAQIKRAYHSLAVRLHPDKGGDTKKFQALQDAYQDVLKKKKEHDVAKAAMDAQSAADNDTHNIEIVSLILSQVTLGLEQTQQAARTITSVAQLNIKLMKEIEARASEAHSGTALKQLRALLCKARDGADDTEDSDGSGVGEGDDWETQSDSSDASGDSEDSDSSLSRWLAEMNMDNPFKKKKDASGATAPSSSSSRGRRGTVRASAGQKKRGPGAVDVSLYRRNPGAFSPTLCIPPLEAICETLQSLSAQAMNLPAGGAKYGIAAAKNQGYIQGIEKCMANGLAALKTTQTLTHSETQVSSCLMRLQYTLFPNAALNPHLGVGLYECEQDQEEHEMQQILAEMVVTSFRSNTVTINIAAERAIAAVVAASSLHAALVEIISTADRERVQAAQRRAEREGEEEERERHFCAEDRAMMSEMREKQMAEEKARGEQQREARKAEEEEKRAKEEEEDREDATGLKALGRLKGQIKSLQVQLHVQHLKTLHQLNREARALQTTLQSKLLSLSVHGANAGTQSRRGSSSSSSESESGSGSSSSADASSRGDSHAGTGTGKAGATTSAGSAVMTLLADLVDSSYAELRASATAAAGAGAGGSGDGIDATTSAGTLEGILAHLGWLVMLPPASADADTGIDAASHQKSGADDKGDGEEKQGSMEDLDASTSGESEAAAPDGSFPPAPPSAADEKAASKSSPEAGTEGKTTDSSNEPLPAPLPTPTPLAAPLALAPDHRSRALWLGCMLFERDVVDMVDIELRARLAEFAVGANGIAATAAASGDGTGGYGAVEVEDGASSGGGGRGLQSAADAFCDEVLAGIRALRVERT